VGKEREGAFTRNLEAASFVAELLKKAGFVRPGGKLSLERRGGDKARRKIPRRASEKNLRRGERVAEHVEGGSIPY